VVRADRERATGECCDKAIAQLTDPYGAVGGAGRCPGVSALKSARIQSTETSARGSWHLRPRWPPASARSGRPCCGHHRIPAQGGRDRWPGAACHCGVVSLCPLTNVNDDYRPHVSTVSSPIPKLMSNVVSIAQSIPTRRLVSPLSHSDKATPDSTNLGIHSPNLAFLFLTGWRHSIAPDHNGQSFPLVFRPPELPFPPIRNAYMLLAPAEGGFVWRFLKNYRKP
jgi:hypothetical protein